MPNPHVERPILTIWRWIFPFFVVAAAVVFFVPAMNGEFLSWDDVRNFLQNQNFRGLARSNLAWMFTTFHMGHYQPLS